MRSRRSTHPRVLAIVCAALGALLLSGCKEGRAPYEVIASQGPPNQFLPPVGLVPGTTRSVGQIYLFDRTKYQLFNVVAGTDPKFVKRDSVLALTAAGTPGAPLSLRLRPDLSDTTLARVYSNPRLFGFQPASPAQADHFVDGRRASHAAEFFPSATGNWWQSKHNQTEWTVVDSIVGPATATTAGAMPVFQLRTTATADPVLGLAEYKPSQYSADIFASAVPGTGVFYHAWTLIAERDIPILARPNRATDRQRNPRFLWLSISSIPNFSGDPAASPPVSIDQCLDGLPGHLDLHPLQLCGDDLQEGETYTTWTYLTVDDDVLHQRLNSEAQVDRGGRCGTDVVVGRDTLRMFPTRTFRLLVRFDVQVERIVDQLVLTLGTTTVGRYPNSPEPGNVVKFAITMTLQGEDSSSAAQFIEMWQLRGIGQVYRTVGVDAIRRSNARLRSCTVDNVFYPPNNPRFLYQEG